MTYLTDSFVVLSSLALFFSGGWIFFLKQLFRDYEVRHLVVLVVFSCTFALSCTMFQLIIFEIVGTLSESSRRFYWRVSLASMLLLVIFVLPYYMAYFLVTNVAILPRARHLRAALAGLLWLGFMTFFWKLGDPFPILSREHGLFTLEQCLGRVGVVGVTIMALL